MALLPLPDAEAMGELGFCAILYFLMTYGFILFKGANLIGDGSELLFQVFGPGIIGGLVIPILGAVPDAAIILFSGIGKPKDKLQESLEVGIGALAGSTVMLLTIPFACTILFGRKYIDPESGRVTGKLHAPEEHGMTAGVKVWASNMGITVQRGIRYSANIMLITSIPYIIILIPAMLYTSASAQHIPAGIGLFSTIIAFVGYNYHCVTDASNLEMQKSKEKKAEFDHWKKTIACQLTGSPDVLTKSLFNKFDTDQSGEVSLKELKAGLSRMGLHNSRRDVKEIMNKWDDSGDQQLQYEEFKQAFMDWLNSTPSEQTSLIDNENPATQNSDEDRLERKSSLLEVFTNEKYSEQSEDVYLEATDFDIQKESFIMLACGTFIIVLFSDPMVEAISAFAKVTGIPSFFVSFIVVPLASNAAELISACQFAAKKTIETATVGVGTCYGAACMNNTLCLGVFFSLIFFQGLKWSFFAETFGLLFCISILGWLGQRMTFKVQDLTILAATYFGSIFLIAILRLCFKE